MKVNFMHKGGRQQEMDKSYADILQKLGRGSYVTRDMRAEEKPVPIVQISDADDLDSMSADELHALAKERGVKVHHASGAEKVREALRKGAE